MHIYSRVELRDAKEAVDVLTPLLYLSNALQEDSCTYWQGLQLISSIYGRMQEDDKLTQESKGMVAKR